jgi:hypothetical protein
MCFILSKSIMTFGNPVMLCVYLGCDGVIRV